MTGSPNPPALQEKKYMRIIETTILLICAACSAVSSPAANRPGENSGEILRELDAVIARRDDFAAQKTHRIDSMKSTLPLTIEPATRLTTLEEVARNYSETQVDSATTYFARAAAEAAAAGMASRAKRYNALHAAHMTSLGQVRESLAKFAAIDTAGMDPEDRRVLCAAGSRVYISAANYYPEGQRRDELLNNAIRYIEGFLMLTPEGSTPYNYMTALINYLNGNGPITEAYLSQVIRETDRTDMYHSFAHELLGLHYLHNELPDEAVPHFAEAAISEIMSGARNGASAGMLARLLLDRGDSDRGHQLLRMALENARASNSKIRFMQAVELSPIVCDTLLQSSSRKSAWIIALIIALIIMTGIAGWLAYRNYAIRKKVNRVRMYIEADDNERQRFFTGFLQLCAAYIGTLENFIRVARRKIKAAQIDDLYKMISAGNMLDRQAEDFYQIFNHAFYQAYPTFVEDINKLLQPDKQIIPSTDKSLTTELRVLAFMRIGFDDSTSIARFLGLSVNTIYTYRNRMRARAISRDTFEEDLMNTGLFPHYDDL